MSRAATFMTCTDLAPMARALADRQGARHYNRDRLVQEARRVPRQGAQRQGPLLQQAHPHPRHAVHDASQVLLVRRAGAHAISALRPRRAHLHTLHIADPPVRMPRRLTAITCRSRSRIHQLQTAGMLLSVPLSTSQYLSISVHVSISLQCAGMPTCSCTGASPPRWVSCRCQRRCRTARAWPKLLTT